MTSKRPQVTASDLVALAVRRTRLRREWSAEELAERCRRIGAKDMTAAVVANIETGRRSDDGARRRRVSVEELMVLAFALDVSPMVLLLPIDEPVTAKVAITATASTSLMEARFWIRGQAPLRGQDAQTFYTEIPHDEYIRGLRLRQRHARTKAERAQVEAELAALEAAPPADGLFPLLEGDDSE